ncbi:cyclin-dependent kinases regulatory subunit-like [Drosophila bipectinata]|uniref:cyclin-dependent kinases regulatory subunit-like n=1 Tax=Drosophila bipectinata TaxID=42026 RepID=UPI001C8A27CB|nr:cyclin-dependent kinases regulatory subunit-like [Drosophila bipectinata]
MPRKKHSKSQDIIYYSNTRSDEQFEYRNVLLPKKLVKMIPKTHPMTEDEWRSIGVELPPSWIHFVIHRTGSHVVLFRCPKTED